MGSHHQNDIAKHNIQIPNIVCITLLLHAKQYFLEAITTLLCLYALKAASGQLDNLKMNNNGVTTTETVFSTTIDITLKHQHLWSCPVYMLGTWIKNPNITDLPKWDPPACLVIYLGHSHVHESSVALLLNH